MNRLFITLIVSFFVLSVMGKAMAAENPFVDVPLDHWAYDAVQQLADDGVINGFGDGTYRGDQVISRYRMAQMVAQAMAKENASAKDQGVIDKLAAEFDQELQNLGVRVESLEKHADKVKWNGMFRYAYGKYVGEKDGEKIRKGVSAGILRLEPSVELDSHWSGHARIDYIFDMKNDVEATESTKNQADEELPQSGLDRLWVQGGYEKMQVLLGKLPYTSNPDDGMVYDENVSGVQFTYGDEIKATVTAGRSRQFEAILEDDDFKSGSYQALEVYNDREKRFTWGVGYHRWSNRDVLYEEIGAGDVNIYTGGLGYKFDENLSIKGAYAWTNSPRGVLGDEDVSDAISSASKRAFSIELDYKNAEPSDKGSFGLFAAYRDLGHYAVIVPIYDNVKAGSKGVEIGVDYVIEKNLMGTVEYFHGKRMSTGGGELLHSEKIFYMELDYYF